MRCAIVSTDECLSGRLRRLARENGWWPDGHDDSPADHRREAPNLVLLGAAQNVDDAKIRATRAAWPKAIIVVFGEATLDSRKRALDCGATDFIQHDAPSDYATARIGALLRLWRGNLSERLKAGELEVDVEHRRCRICGRDVPLSQREFDLAAIMVSRHGITLTRSELIERLWGAGAQTEDNALEVQISRLRKKMRPESGCTIVTVRGVGYRLQVYDVAASLHGKS